MFDFDWHPHSNLGLIFGFVLLIIIINGIFGWLRWQSAQATIREAARAGTPISPEMLRDIGDDDKRGGSVMAGFILLAVAGGIAFMGHQLEKASDDPQVFDVMLGAAGFPALIGVVLIVFGVVENLSGKSKR